MAVPHRILRGYQTAPLINWRDANIWADLEEPEDRMFLTTATLPLGDTYEVIQGRFNQLRENPPPFTDENVHVNNEFERAKNLLTDAVDREHGTASS